MNYWWKRRWSWPAKEEKNRTTETQMKREELLKYAQEAITGLKISADLARIDVEVSSFRSKLDISEVKLPPNDTNKDMTLATTEAIKETLAQVRVYSKLKTLLLEKKAIYCGDSPETHAQKVDKLKILLESLASSTIQAENRIQDHRCHKEEALSYRQAKVFEVSQVEQELTTEIEELEKQKNELEAQLKKVSSSLVTANSRLRNAREERQHFDEASKEILQHLQTKEEELSKSVVSCRREADAAKACISFIEDAWDLQSKCAKQKEEQVNDELGRYTEFFSDLIMRLLPAYKIELGNFMNRYKDLMETLKSNDGLNNVANLDFENQEEYFKSVKKRKHLEEEYLDLEAKLITTFSVVEGIKQLYAQNEDFSRKQNQRVCDLLKPLQDIKDEFDSVERPNLRVETPSRAAWRAMGNKERKEKFSRLRSSKEEYSLVQVVDGQDFLDSDEELATLESEFVKIIRDHAAEEIDDWEL